MGKSWRHRLNDKSPEQTGTDRTMNTREGWLEQGWSTLTVGRGEDEQTGEED